MNQVTETNRLRIRKFNESDSGFILQLLNSPGWLKFIGDRNIKSLEDAKHYIENSPLFSYIKFGFGPYLVELKESGIPIGMCSLIRRDTLEDVDLGFAFLDEYLRKGYAREASQAVIDYSKNTLGIKKLVAITNADNVASISLLEKLNFISNGKIKLPNEEDELFFFTLTH